MSNYTEIETLRQEKNNRIAAANKEIDRLRAEVERLSTSLSLIKEAAKVVASNLRYVRDEACTDFLGTGSCSKTAAKEEARWNECLQACFDGVASILEAP